MTSENNLTLDDSTRLGQFLRRHRLVSQADLDDALDRQKRSGLYLGELLSQAQQIKAEVIHKLLEEQHQIRELIHLAEREVVDAVTRLGYLLHLHGHVSSENLESAIGSQQREGGRLGDILLREGHVSVQALHDTLTHQSKLRSVLVATLASLVMAGSVLPQLAQASSGDSASVTITLQILPPRPEIVMDNQLNADHPFDVTGATFQIDENGSYIVQPMQFTPSGLPTESLQFHLDENATSPSGIMNIFVSPR